MALTTNFEAIPQQVHTADKTSTAIVNGGATSQPSTNEPKYLIASPYTELEHQLDLNTVDHQSALLARALTHLESPSSKYATTAYGQALNWIETSAQLQALCKETGHLWTKQTFYVVEFRSQLKELSTPNREKLSKLDKESHREAVESGGLLKYWFGTTDDDVQRRNLATCVWTNKEAAVAGGKGPWHKNARGFVSTAYESINVKGLVLTIEDDAEDWIFESYH